MPHRWCLCIPWIMLEHVSPMMPRKPAKVFRFSVVVMLSFVLNFALFIHDAGCKGERQFNGLIDVYKKTLASDGIAGLYRGFVVSCVGIVVYRGV